MNPVPEAFNELGFLLGLMIMAVITLVLLLIVLFGYDRWRRSDDDLTLWIPFTGLFGVGLLVSLGAFVVSLVPFDTKYYHYYEVTGQVESVSNVLDSASGDLTRQPVVRLDNVERPVVVDDPRAVELEDKEVTLRCTIEWNYQAADSYSCRIVNFGG